MVTAATDPMARKPVTPRDAASLVVLRRAGGEPEVLLGRREPRHRFMPNVLVFPGGRLDPGDFRQPVARRLRPAVAARMARHVSPARAQGLAVAAVRETFEETGLVFGEIRGGALCPALDALDFVARAITPPDSPIRFHARFFMADAARAGGTLAGNGELLDLRWFGLEEAVELPLADVTEFVLGEVARRLGGAEPAGVPLFSYRHGRAVVRYR